MSSSSKPRERFRLLTLQDVLNRPPRQHLVRGILGRGELALAFGPPDSAKTFLVAGLALCLASGEEWHGHAVHAGPVVYVSMEGSGGFGQRLRAWIKFNKKGNDLLLYVVEEPVQFMEDGDVDQFIAALEELPSSPVLIVIDTLARCLSGGDENTARDMGRAITGCDRIRRSTGATVLLIHHSARDRDSERGSTALRGAVNTALAVSRSENGGVVLSCVKQKDDAPFGALLFDLRVVDLGVDEEGCPISSCVLSPKWGGTEGGESHGGLGPTSSTMCQVLRDSFFEDGATSDQWRAAAKVAKTTFYRHRKELVEESYVERFEHRGHERFRIGRRFTETSSPTVPPSSTQSQASSGTSPTPPPPLKGEVGRTGTGTKTTRQPSFPHVKKPRTSHG